MSNFAPLQRKLARTTPTVRQRTPILPPSREAEQSNGKPIIKPEASPDRQDAIGFSFANIPIDPPVQNAHTKFEEYRENHTGLPNKLKAEVESLSGISLDDVRVHYNSSRPAMVQALAYTKGTDIYVGQGQEKHLPHEAWHVVQQIQGRVKPTMHLQSMAINNNLELEHEADVMPTKLTQGGKRQSTVRRSSNSSRNIVIQRTPGLQKGHKVKVHTGRNPQKHQTIITGTIEEATNSYYKVLRDDNNQADWFVEHVVYPNDMQDNEIHKINNQQVREAIAKSDKRSDSTGSVQQAIGQPAIQMPVKIKLKKEDIPDLPEELMEGIDYYNNKVEAFGGKENSIKEKDLLEILNKMLGLAEVWYQKLYKNPKQENQLHKLTEEIRYAISHIRPANPGLPMLTMLPWEQMETLGIASPFHSEHFENIFPEHQINLPSGGIWGSKKLNELMEQQNESRSQKSLKYNYVVLIDLKGWETEKHQDKTRGKYKKVYKLLFCKEEKDLAKGGHIDLAGKDRIAAGGEIEIRVGQIKSVDNSSGHYLPKGPSPKQAVINAFQEAGFGDISSKYVEKKWSEQQKAWVKVKEDVAQENKKMARTMKWKQQMQKK